MKRFYKDVSVGDGNTVLLDGKPVKTPAHAALALPTRALAEAVAAEWRAQDTDIKPETMILTKLANTAIDRIAGREAEAARDILAYANDLLCYRADAPPDLVERQRAAWDPLLDWAAARYGARLKTASGIAHIAQDDDAKAAFAAALLHRDAFDLAALHTAATILGSLVLTLALVEGRLDADEAFALSQLDERYQAEKWGLDREAEIRAANLAAELAAAARFLRLARA